MKFDIESRQETDPVKQSMPFSYYYIDAVSTDGQPHNVQVYSDISAGTCILVQLQSTQIHLDE